MILVPGTPIAFEVGQDHANQHRLDGKLPCRTLKSVSFERKETRKDKDSTDGFILVE